MEEKKWQVGDEIQRGQTTFRCVESSVEQTQYNFDMHYYVFRYVLKSGKLSKGTWTMVGKSYDLKHIYNGRF